MSCNRRFKKAFTLTELLVVVAIISILATLALPNFMNAQVKAKVSRAHMDMRTLGIAVEMYHVDRGAYPPWLQNRVVVEDNAHPNEIRYYRLTTPTSYISEIPVDPFASEVNEFDWVHWGFSYDYVDAYDPANGIKDPDAWGHVWRINSWGPDCTNGHAGRYIGCVRGKPEFIYCPTNGLTSAGDILRVGDKGGPFVDLYCPIHNGD